MCWRHPTSSTSFSTEAFPFSSSLSSSSSPRPPLLVLLVLLVRPHVTSFSSFCCNNARHTICRPLQGRWTVWPAAARARAGCGGASHDLQLHSLWRTPAAAVSEHVFGRAAGGGSGQFRATSPGPVRAGSNGILPPQGWGRQDSAQQTPLLSLLCCLPSPVLALLCSPLLSLLLFLRACLSSAPPLFSPGP